jgi:hypothetical protein
MNFESARTFIGVKIVTAEPCPAWQQFGDHPAGAPGYKVTYEDGYVSWSPQAVFDAAYRWVEAMSFGLALEALKLGKKVARQGWNGKGMWLSLSGPERRLSHEQFWSNNNGDFARQQPDGQATVLPSICMKTADDKILMGWLASQTDMLADDWHIVED